ncbi:FG-GAP-like repeat-containing protein [Streptomyces sp. NPDC059070]|uniref:FG-GAP-like repeat-containing protein n=1 Tax=unclassified Streptomyces TaxID=2593676 RepID=UPI0034E1A1BD
MATTTGRTRGRIAVRVAAAAITAALVGTGTTAVAADAPHTPSAFEAAQNAKGTKDAKDTKSRNGLAAAPSAEAGDEDFTFHPLFGVDRSDWSWMYLPNGKGGFTERIELGPMPRLKSATLVDNNADGTADGMWSWDYNGNLRYAGDEVEDEFRVGGGWNIYDKVLSPGNLGGAKSADLLARDKSGTLYLYLGYGNGKLTSRYKVGGGWGQYTQIAGNGDLTGDGKADIVARDRAGTLWLYKGTGNHKSPFEARTKIGGGWNTYNTILSSGDVNLDGKPDLLGRDSAGALYLYKGTGDAKSPFKQRVKIGNSGWNTYRLMF